MRIKGKLIAVTAVLGLIVMPVPTSVAAPAGPSAGHLLVDGLQGTIGGVIGPDRALYVPEGVLGKITRIDPRTGVTSVFASGLPAQVIPLGGAIDIAFIGNTAYVLVTLVSDDVGGNQVDGIYRVDGPHSFTVIADLGTFSRTNPPRTAFDVPTGLQFAMEPIRGGFLVSDGHHNRVLKVGLDGSVSELIGFDNVVPTGMAVSGNTVYLAQAGPIPHNPEDGKVISFGLHRPVPRGRASGYSLIVDVESDHDGTLYALSQGDSPGNVPAASPALPDSGELLRVNRDGTFTAVVDGLNRPTSVHFIGDTAYVVTLNGEVWKIGDVSKLAHDGQGGDRD
jgi:hypothetical protein